MLHLIYLLAFTVLAVIAVSNMIRNLVRLGTQVQQPTRPNGSSRSTPHPELLNDSGEMINEPLLVMRSVSIQDAREQLNALYEASSGSDDSTSEEN